MTKKIIILESQLNSILEETEEISFSDYTDEDYFDAFFYIFRKWLKKKHGEETFRYPMSYLLNQYSKEFILDTLGQDFLSGRLRDEGDDYRINRWDLPRVVQELVKKKVHNLPSVQKQESFLEKYQSFIDMIVPSLELPNFVNLRLEEKKPQRVTVTPVIGYEEWLKHPERFYTSRGNMEKKFLDYLENFLGVEIGNPAHGQTEILFRNPSRLGEEEWIKQELNKKLKKQIRALPYSQNLKAIRFTADDSGGEMKLIFKDMAGWSQRREFKNSVQELLTQEGYGPNLRLES